MTIEQTDLLSEQFHKLTTFPAQVATGRVKDDTLEDWIFNAIVYTSEEVLKDYRNNKETYLITNTGFVSGTIFMETEKFSRIMTANADKAIRILRYLQG